MREILKRYVEEFNKNDCEIYKNEIPNDLAYEWLSDRIPLFECPDKELERTYYFRFWTYRKHIKKTPEGFAVTEFLPKVPWSGKYNIINAPVGHHFTEGRWLRGSKNIFSDYLRFYLNNQKDSHRYSAWLLWSALEYEKVRGEFLLGKDELAKMAEYYQEWEKTHKLPSGLFWSYDGYDAMEFSISGTRGGSYVKGIRPTLNSYMYGEALAISHFADRLGDEAIKAEFEKKAENLRKLINKTLIWNGFYKALHGECDEDAEKLHESKDDTGSPRELIGYIPFMFDIPEGDMSDVFKLLDDKNVFLANTGLSTADISDPRYMGEFSHECLWNGYVWPFATSQTLTALIKVIHNGHPEYKGTLIRQIKLYSDMHRITLGDKTLPWIDEVMSPYEKKWTSREILENLGWRENLGGVERGKDYNHSTFCDLVITGIVGVRTDTDELTLDPAIPEEWDYMKLDNLEYRGRLYTVVYDKTGEHYGLGKGLNIIKKA